MIARRRWLQFSLRTFLIAVTAFAVWLGWMVNSARTQREAVRGIEEVQTRMDRGRTSSEMLWLRAHAVYDYQVGSEANIEKARSIVPAFLIKWFGVDFFHTIVKVNISGPISDDTLQRIGRLPKVKDLSLWEAHYADDKERVTEAGLDALRNMHSVEQLRLDLHGLAGQRPITDRGMQFLEGMPRLRELTISGNVRLTDDSLAIIGRLAELQTLQLASRNLTDNGLKSLIGLRQLTNLDLQLAGITDDGIQWLAKLPNLRSLLLGGTKISGEGLGQLAESNRLETLVLTGTRFTDAHVHELTGLHTLSRLAINAPSVSAAELATLQSLPNLSDVWILGVIGDMTPYYRALPKSEIHFSGQPPLDSDDPPRD